MPDVEAFIPGAITTVWDKRAKKALKLAKASATRAAKGKKPTISSSCANALKDAAIGVVGGLGV